MKQVLKGCNGRYLTFNSDGTIGCTAEEVKENNKIIVRTRGDKVSFNVIISYKQGCWARLIISLSVIIVIDCVPIS